MNPLPAARVMDRRTALKWVAAVIGVSLIRPVVQGAPVPPGTAGYGLDPDLLKGGEAALWPRTFTPAQRATATALCDIIIPADDRSPGAAAVGVPDFLDEWISAPYPEQQADAALILPGLAWIEAEAQRRFQHAFTGLTEAQAQAICDDVRHVSSAAPEFRDGAKFFKRFRDLTAGGFYTTPEGIKDIGYVGNMPLGEFAGPPPEVLARIGLA